MTGEVDDDLQGLESQEQEVEVDYEKEAKALGWVPEDKFKGKKDKWVNAQEFVERGKSLMPILLANNERLKGELLTRDQKIGTLQSQLDNASVAIERLEKHYSEANKRAVETALVKLKEELKQAREDGDVDAEIEIIGKIEETKTAQRNAEKPEDKKPAPAKSDLDPELVAWQKENDWYGVDKKKTKAFNRLAEDLREEGLSSNGRQFLDDVSEKFEELYGEKAEEEDPPRRPSKVESSAPSRSAGGGKSKGWADLPKEAKESCLADADALVGPNKRYKDLDSWKAAYAKIYHAD